VSSSKSLLQHQYHQLQSSLASSPGLFSITGLHHPQDFLQLTKEAIHKSDTLGSSIPTHISFPMQAQEVLYQLDDISKMVCNVIDAADLCQ
jgi:hypothetical protein